MKKFQKILFSVLALLLVVQSTSTGIFADTSEGTPNMSVEEVAEDVNEEIEAEEEISTFSPADIGFDQLTLTFVDIKGQSVNNAQIKTGAQTTATLTVGIGGSENIEANRLAFKIVIPKNKAFSTSETTEYDVKFGSINSPTGTPDPESDVDYVWFIIKNKMSVGAAQTLEFLIKPFKIGVAADQKIDMPVTSYYLNEDGVAEVLDYNVTGTVASYANIFSHSNVNTEVYNRVQNVTNQSSETLYDYRIVQYTNPQQNGAQGNVNTLKVTYQNTYQVDLDKHGEPLIKFTRSNITKDNGDQFSAGELSVVTSPGGFVKEFTVVTEAVGDGVNQLTNTSGVFKISGAKFSATQIQNEFNLAPNQSRKMSIKNTATSAKAFPIGKVSDTDKTEFPLTVNTVPALEMNYTNADEIGDETSKQKVEKRITKIANINTTHSDLDKLGAYQNDIVTFDFAGGWQNKQKNTIDEVVITEYVDSTSGLGYKSTELSPLKVMTGIGRRTSGAIDTTKLEVYVTYSDTGRELIGTVDKTTFSKSQSFTIDKDRQDKVTKIEYVYKDVEPNFYIFTGPSIDYRVLEQKDPTAQGRKFKNSVELKFKYNGKEYKENSNEVFFRYRDVFADKAGTYGINKSGQNLIGHSFQEKNDVYLFTIELENKTNDPVFVKTIDDKFTYNLSPYNGKNYVNNDPTSKEIEDKYLAANDVNLVIWNDEESEELPIADQSIIENIHIAESATTSSSDLVITFKDQGLELPQGVKVRLTYTMYVNDRFEEDATIGNNFIAKDAADEIILSGQWTSSKIIDHPTDNTSTFGKRGENLSGITLSERPYTNDIIVYTLEITNDKDFDWTDILIADTYSQNLKPYTSLNYITQERLDSYGFAAGNEANMNLTVKKDVEGELVMPEGFDMSEVTMVRDDVTNSFKVALGSNVLKPEEKVFLIYTMQLDDDAQAKETIINNYRVFADEEYVSSGRHTWNVNDQAKAKGLMSIVHSVEGVAIGGIKPTISGLLNHEILEFGIEISNFLPRVDRIVNVKNVHAYVPDYFLYVDDSIYVASKVSTPKADGTYETTEIEIADTEYTVVYDKDENILKVKFNEDYELPGGIQGSDFNKSTHSIVIKYNGEVVSEDERFTPIDSNVFNARVQSSAVAFYKEERSELLTKNGALYEKKDDSPYQDGDDETKSYLAGNSDYLYVLNERNPFGYISKFVDSADQNLDLMTQNNLERKYSVGLYNTAFRDYTVTHVVDLLADYETVKEDAPITLTNSTAGGGNEVYDAVYEIDKVTVEGKKYNRLKVTGYMKDGVEEPINMEAITQSGEYTSWTLNYAAKVDVETAKNDLFVVDAYTSTYINKVAMYTDEAITLARPNGVNTTTATLKTDDHLEDTNWDSDDATTNRYQTEVQVRSTLSAVAPFLNARSQVVEVTNNGIVYRDSNMTDQIIPSSIVAWRMTIGNSNMANTPVIKEGSIVAIELPDGLTFEGYRDNALPDFLEEVSVSPTERILVWKTTRDITADGTQNVFTVRTNTRPGYYETYTIKAFFVPVNVNEFGFINSKIKSTWEYSRFTYEPTTGALPEALGFGTDRIPHVYASESINVLGNTSIGGHLTVKSLTNGSQSATTSKAPYFTTLSDVEDTVQYSMLFEVYKPGSGIKDVTLINRLSGENDRFVNRDQFRGSEGKLKLVDNGSFTANLVNATNGQVIQKLDVTEYSVEYSVKEYDYKFTENDWLDGNKEIWMDESELLAAGYTFDDVTATRTIISNDIEVEMNQAIRVDFIAELDEYYMENWQVNNSFAYNAKVNGTIPVRIETRDLGLKAKVNTDRLKVTTEVIDPALTPLQTEFEFDVVGYNKDTEEEEFRVTKVVDVTDVNGSLINTLNVDELNRNMTYKVEPKSYVGFRVPTVETTSSTDNFGLTSWDAKLTYERIVYDEVAVDVEVNTINDKRPITAIGYTIEKNGLPRTVDEEYRIVDILDSKGQDVITTFETGSQYTVVADDVKYYDVEVIQLDSEDLDTTGVKDHFKIVYTQQEETDPNKDKDKDGEKDKDGVNTGIQNNGLVYLGILAGAAVVAGLVFFTKTKKEK